MFRQQSGSGSESEDPLDAIDMVAHLEGESPGAALAPNPEPPAEEDSPLFDYGEIKAEIIEWCLAQLNSNRGPGLGMAFGREEVAPRMPLGLGLVGRPGMWIQRTVNSYILPWQCERLWSKGETIQELLSGTLFALHATIISGLGQALNCKIKAKDAGLPEDDSECPGSPEFVNSHLIMQMKAPPRAKLAALKALGINKPHLAFLTPSKEAGYYEVGHIEIEDLLQASPEDFGELWWPHLDHIRENYLATLGLAE